MEYINRLLHRSPTNSSSPSMSPVPESDSDSNTFSEAAVSELEVKRTEAVRDRRVEEISSDINESKTVTNDIDRDKEDLDNINERDINENTNKNKPVTEVSNNSGDINNTDEKRRDEDNTNENIKTVDNIIYINENEKSTDNIIKEETYINGIYIKETSVDCIDNDKSHINQELQSLNITTKDNNDCNKKEEVIGISKDINEQESVKLECKNNLPETIFIENKRFEEKPVIINDIRNQVSLQELNDADITWSSDICTILDSLNEAEQCGDFNPQRQRTLLSDVDTTYTFKDLELTAEEIADDIFRSSLEFEDAAFTTPIIETFEDPMTFDFLLARRNSQRTNSQRNESLYIKFDPLLNNTSMLPQENGKTLSTPFSNIIYKLDEIREKSDEPIQVSRSDTEKVKETDVTDVELVRATVLQLEKALEKQNKEFKVELAQQKTAFEEKIIKFQAKLSHEIENKNRLTVVVDEYEKSISRLLTEKERDRANLEQEKTKLQEELQTTNYHLSSTEAAFNDVHLKYERLKGVVAAYKNNEEVLKESIQENLETIKSLENRYEQLKTHAMSQLNKANYELVDVRKQHEAETAKLHALVRKAELKSNSLAAIVEQKTKENKELTQILDELIARVGHQAAE